MKKLIRKIKGSKSGSKIRKKNVEDDSDSNQDSSKHVVDPQDPSLITRPPAPGPSPRPSRQNTVSPIDPQDDVGTFSGFDNWLSSFTPDPHERNVVEMPVQEAHRETLAMKGFNPDECITVILNGVKKPSHAGRFTVAIQGPYYMTIEHVTRLLKVHGYEAPISAKHASRAVPQWNPTKATPKEFQIFAVNGSSCYDPDAESGLLISKDEPVTNFEEKVRQLRVRCKGDKVEVTSFPAKLEITFDRALRLPEDGKVHNQPSGVGHVPVSNMACIYKKLQNSGNASLMDMARKGGVFFPLYQREAMFLSFKATNDNFAVRTFVGGVNAVSGLPWNTHPSQKSSKQDYISVPPQRFLDGITTARETVRQFIAMPLGSGYSVEKQVTGKEDVGGMQLEIIPGRQWYVRPQLAPNLMSYQSPRELNEDCVILDWRSPETENPYVTTIAETVDAWIQEHSPIYMRHLYRSQIRQRQTIRDAWQPGIEVYMTAVYKLKLVLTYEYLEPTRTMNVEWPPWWTLEECMKEMRKVGRNIWGIDLNYPNLRLLYKSRFLEAGCLNEQGIEDNSVIQVGLVLPTQPSSFEQEQPQRPSYPAQQAPGSIAPPGPKIFIPNYKGASGTVAPSSSDSKQPMSVPSILDILNRRRRQSCAEQSIPHSAHSAPPMAPIQRMDIPECPGTFSVLRPQCIPESGSYSAAAVKLALSSPSPPFSAPGHSSPPRLDTAASRSSRPASTQHRPKQTDQTGWAMGIAAGSRIRQVINKDPFSAAAWCKHRATILSIQILNSVAFESLTGMLAPPSPITPEMYKQQGLPFFASYGEAIAADGEHTLSGVKSVGQLDSEGGRIQLGSTLSGSNKVACTCCRRMLCDSILRPCNHTFCSSCVSNYMTYHDSVFCRICSTRASKLLGFSAPMALPGEDRADFSDVKVVTLKPHKGAVGFHSIYELEGDTCPHT